MTISVRELRHERAAEIEKARQLVDMVDAQKRAMSEQETHDYDGFMARIDELEAEIERREKLEELESELAKNSDTDPKIGMSAKELRSYSLLRAILAAANGDWRGAELEREASEATAQKLGMAPQGFFVPQDWLESRAHEERAMNVGTLAQGGYLVATDLQSQNFIGLLKNRAILRAAGATYMGGLVGDLAIPKQTGGATGYWLAEGDTATESTPAVGQVPLKPKTVGAYTELTRKLLKQSSIDVETFVRTELASTLALLIDKAGLHGAGGNEPTGIANTSGIGSVVGGATGAAPTWANIVDLETQVAIDNADIGSLAYVSNAKVRGKLKTTLVNATAGSDMIWPLNSNQVNGYPFYVTNQVRSDLTKSTGTNLSAIFFGNWADLIVGMWGGLDILVNPYAKDTSGTVRVTALQDVDVAIRHAESFAAMLDAATA